MHTRQPDERCEEYMFVSPKKLQIQKSKYSACQIYYRNDQNETQKVKTRKKIIPFFKTKLQISQRMLQQTMH